MRRARDRRRDPRVIAPVVGADRRRAVNPLLAQGRVERALDTPCARRANPDSRGRGSERVPGDRCQVARDGPLGALDDDRRLAGGPARPARPARCASLTAQRRYGASAGVLGAAAARRCTPDATGGDRRARDDHLRAGSTARRARSPVPLHEPLRAAARAPRVAIMCRNHRGFVQAAAAASRLGCDLVPLNTDFAGPQLARRARARGRDRGRLRRGVRAGVRRRRVRRHAHASPGIEQRARRRPTLDALIALRRTPTRPPPARARPHDHADIRHDRDPEGRRSRTVRRAALVPLASAASSSSARFKPTPRSGRADRGLRRRCSTSTGMIGLVRRLRRSARRSCSGAGSTPRRRSSRLERHRVETLLAVPDDAQADHGPARPTRASATTRRRCG